MKKQPMITQLERIILGSLWLDESQAYMELLTEQDFSLPEHKEIFNILKKYPIRIDPFLLKARLKAEGLKESIAKYLLECAGEVSNIGNISDYHLLLTECKTKNTVWELAVKNNGDITTEEIEIIHNITAPKSEVKTEVNTLSELGLGFVDILEKREKFFAQGFPYPTGIEQLDQSIGGINPKSVVVIGGRTSVGKSSIMTQIACHIASKGKKVLYLTGEMTGQDLFDRIIANRAPVEAYKIKYGRVNEYEKKRIIDCLSENNFFDSPLKICFIPIMTLKAIKEMIDKIKPEIVFIDHIQLLSLEKSDSVAQSITEAMNEFKRIAGERNIGVVVGSQLSRAIEHANIKGKEYSNIFFKGSGGIEEASDVAMKLELEEKEDKSNLDWKMVLEITKNRYGKIGPVYLTFERQYLKFIEREA